MNEVSALPARHKLDVDVFYRMAELGLFGVDPRVELIEGDVIDMAPIGNDHMATVNRLTRALVLACGDRAIVSVQNTIRLNRFNAPQPDFTVLRAREDFYAKGGAGPEDVLLLVEVADSSVMYDRTVKLDIYARTGIQEYWIVDLKRRLVKRFRAPAADGYGEESTHHRGERLALAAMPEVEADLDFVLG